MGVIDLFSVDTTPKSNKTTNLFINKSRNVLD